MPATKKTLTSPKSSAIKTSATTGKTGAKKSTASAGVVKKAPTALATKTVAPKNGAMPKKATAKKTTASVSVSRTSNPRTGTATIKKITRNIVGFYMTEDIEIRSITRSDNISNEKLKAKYAQLKTKIKSR